MTKRDHNQCPYLTGEAISTAAGLECPVTGRGFCTWLAQDESPCRCDVVKDIGERNQTLLSDAVYVKMGKVDSIPFDRRPKNEEEIKELLEKAEAFRNEFLRENVN